MPEALPIIAVDAAAAVATEGSVDAVVLAAYAAPGFGLGAATAATGATAAGIALPSLSSVALNVGLGVAVSYGISLLTKAKLDSGAGQLTTKQGLPSRFVVLGRQKLAGTMFFYDSTSSGLLCVGKILACHPINTIESHFLLQYQVHLSSGNSGSVIDAQAFGRANWNNLITILTHDGTQTVVDANFTSLWATFSSPNAWPSSCVLNGLAYAIIEYKDAPTNTGEFYSDYPNGAPEYRAVVQGAKVWDPRVPGCKVNDQTTWVYSDNAALVIARYMIDADGWDLPTSVLNASNIATQADICDQTLPNPDGTNEARWRIWGRYDLTEQRKSVLADLLMACAGRIIPQADGTVLLLVGQKLPASVTFTDDDVIGWDSFTDGPEAVDRVDIVRPRIMYEPADWADYDVPAVLAPRFSTSQQTTNTLDLTLRFCPSPYQAQRVARKIADEKNAGWRGNIRTKLTGLQAYGQWVIGLNLASLPILSSLLFEVTNFSLDLATMTCVIGVREMSPDVWDWTAGTGTAILPFPASLGTTFPATAPTFSSITPSTSAHTITANWTNAAGTATNQFQYRIEASSTSANGWIEDDPAVGATTQTTPALSNSTTWQVRVRAISASGAYSAYTTSTGYNV